MTQEFKPTVVYGGVSGYINTEVEVKYANNANKTVSKIMIKPDH